MGFPNWGHVTAILMIMIVINLKDNGFYFGNFP